MSTKLPNLRALVLDDDPVYRRIVTTSLQRIGISEVASASDLNIARSKLLLEKFDIITIDVVLREGSGLDLLAWLKKNQPSIISILVTAGSNSAACREVDALLLGASALVLKPGGTGAAARLDQSFRDIIEGILRDRQPMQPAAPMRPATPVVATPDVSIERSLKAETRELIAVGASTGGPPVIMQFLETLPKDFRTPIVLTQHMPALHIPHFAKLLKDRSKREVVVPAHGERVQPGHVYVAPGGLHLTVHREGLYLVIKHDDGPEEHHCKPAVDPMFRSVANACGHKAIGIVMTGMGSDGALGAVALRARGAPVIVQDKPSSVVWGMPGATAQKGAASIIVPGNDIATWVTRLDSSCQTLAKQPTGSDP